MANNTVTLLSVHIKLFVLPNSLALVVIPHKIKMSEY